MHDRRVDTAIDTSRHRRRTPQSKRCTIRSSTTSRTAPSPSPSLMPCDRKHSQRQGKRGRVSSGGAHKSKHLCFYFVRHYFTPRIDHGLDHIDNIDHIDHINHIDPIAAVVRYHPGSVSIEYISNLGNMCKIVQIARLR